MARACLKSASGLRRLEKNLIFSRCLHVFDLVLKYCSDINKRNWLQLLFFFILLMGLIASVFGMSFFSSVFQFSGRSNLVLHFYGNICNWILKQISSKMDWFWVLSSWNIAFFIDFISAWIETCMNCLNLFFFQYNMSFRQLLWGTLWSVL